MTTHSPLVSVIIPIYGVEKYIERCAISLFEQTLDNIEFIFVNDCTQDNSIQILNKVIEQYPNVSNKITIINHKENLGLPQARRTGLLNAKGEYIAHCDSDDYIHKNMYSLMYQYAKGNDYDLIFCDFNITDNNTCYEKKYFPNAFEDKKQLYYALFQGGGAHAVWGTMCKKEVYNKGILFPTANMGEDYVIVTQLIYYATKIGYLQKALYYYCQNSNSMMNNSEPNKKIKFAEQLKKNLDIVISFLEHKKICLEHITPLKFNHTLQWLFYIRNRQLLSNRDITYKDLNYKIYFNRQISFIDKIRFFIVSNRLHFLIDWKLKFFK
ncbi:MAG: glycosyltransferase [Bacteroidales bacterium]|nr:glycosyltransferase [Bacteroidales bacterium]